MSGLRPALCSVTLRHLQPAAVIDAAADAGLAAIEWGGDVHVPPGDINEARRVGERTRGAGLAVSSYGAYLVAPDSPADMVHRAVETAAALGAHHIRIWPGTRDRPSQGYTSTERAAVASAIVAIADEASRHAITVGLEFHPGSLTDDSASARALVDAIGRDDVYLYWQPAPGLPLEAALDELTLIGPDVCHLHVFAWDAERRRYPLADHAAYWSAVFGALPAGRWQKPRYAMLEFVAGDDLAQLRSDAASLIALCDAPGAGPRRPKREPGRDGTRDDR